MIVTSGKTLWKDERIVHGLSMLPIVFGFLLAFASTAHTSLDSLLYLENSLNLVEHGTLDHFRAGFTVVLGLFLHIFDDPIFAGTVFIRIVFFLSICLVYYLAFRLEGPVYGFIASLLFLTNGFFHFLGARILLDNYYPFLSLIVILVSTSIYQRPSYTKATFAALFFFYTLTVKVSILFILPLAIALTVFSPSRWTEKKLWIASAIPFGIGISAYIILKAVLNDVANTGGFSEYVIDQVNAVGLTNIFNIAAAFVERYIEPTVNTKLALVTVIYVFIRAYSSLTARILVLALILSSPMVFILGTVGLRHAQAAGLVYILILIFSYAIYDFPRVIFAKHHRHIATTVTTLLVLLICWNQLFFSRYPGITPIRDSKIVKIIKGEDHSWRSKGTYNDTLEKILRKTIQNPLRKTKVFIHFQNLRSVQYFIHKEKIPSIELIPTRSLATRVRLDLSNIEKSLNSLRNKHLENKQFLTTHRGSLRIFSAENSLEGGNVRPIRMTLLGIADLLSVTENNTNNLLLITNKNAFMKDYFHILGIQPVAHQGSYSMYDLDDLRKKNSKSMSITCVNKYVWELYKTISIDHPESQAFYDIISDGRLNNSYINSIAQTGRCIM